MLVISLDVSVYFISANIPFRYYENVRTRTQKSSLFQEPEILWLAHSIGNTKHGEKKI